jgi:hypothetical protein
MGCSFQPRDISSAVHANVLSFLHVSERLRDARSGEVYGGSERLDKSKTVEIDGFVHKSRVRD